MNPNTFHSFVDSARILVEQGLFEESIEVLSRTDLGINDNAEWNQLWSLFELFPIGFWDTHPKATQLYAKALRCLGNLNDLHLLAEKHRGETAFAPVSLEDAAGLNILHRFDEAENLLQEIIPNLYGENLGIALARLGYAAFKLSKDWESAYQKATSLLSGEELGRALLNYGYCLSMSGRSADAKRVWLEALNYFKHNPYFLVWTRYNLATMALNHEEPEAERHLLEALKHVHHAKAQSLQATIWNSLGRFRMQLGEWSRAEFAFDQTLNAKADKHDRQSAYRGLVRAKYLAGRLGETLETLEAVLHDPDLEHSLLYVAQAKVLD